MPDIKEHLGPIWIKPDRGLSPCRGDRYFHCEMREPLSAATQDAVFELLGNPETYGIARKLLRR